MSAGIFLNISETRDRHTIDFRGGFVTATRKEFCIDSAGMSACIFLLYSKDSNNTSTISQCKSERLVRWFAPAFWLTPRRYATPYGESHLVGAHGNLPSSSYLGYCIIAYMSDTFEWLCIKPTYTLPSHQQRKHRGLTSVYMFSCRQLETSDVNVRYAKGVTLLYFVELYSIIFCF